MAGAGDSGGRRSTGWFKGLFDPTAQFHAAAQTYTSLQKLLEHEKATLASMQQQQREFFADDSELSKENLKLLPIMANPVDQIPVTKLQERIREKYEHILEITERAIIAAEVVRSKYAGLPKDKQTDSSVKEILSSTDKDKPKLRW